MDLARPRNDDDGTMSFGDHLEELRRRILLAFLPALPLAVILFFLSDTVIEWLVLPLRRVLEANDLPVRLVNLAPPEAILIQLKLSVIVAAIGVGPWILWQAWLFVRPGLYAQERRFVHFLVPGSALLTVAAVALLYYVMLPLILQVLVRVGADLDLGPGHREMDPRVVEVLEADPPIRLRTTPPVDPAPGDAWLLWPDLDLHVAVDGPDGTVEVIQVRRSDRGAVAQEYRLSIYISFVLMLLLGMVVAFQMPLVIVLLGWMGLVSPQWLRQQRKYAAFGCGVVAALITPADVVSMLAMLVPLYGLFELGILLLWIAPASKVAEGTVFSSGKSGDGSADKPGRQPVKPVQAESALPRSAQLDEDQPEEGDEPADGESGP